MSKSGRIENMKENYVRIREQVFTELKKMGYSADVNNLLNRQQINAIAYLAIKSAYDKYIYGESNFDKNFNKQDWLKYENGFVNVLEHHDELVSMIREARRIYDKGTAKSYEKPCIFVDEKNSPMTQTVDQQIIAQARVQAEQIIAEARSKADAIIADAQAQKDRLISMGEDAKNALIEQGTAEKNQIINDVADDEFKNALEVRIKESFAQERQSRFEDRAKLDSEYGSIVKAKDDMLESLDAGAQNLHSSLMQVLENAQNELQRVQGDIHSQLDTWQRRLFKNDFRDVAMCFINLDKIITAMENKIASELAFGNEGYHSELAEELQKHTKNLLILKNNFETALAKNSIKLLIPKVGDGYNPNYHRAENLDLYTENEDSFSGRPITSVKEAGLVRVLNSGDETIFRAIVTVEK